MEMQFLVEQKNGEIKADFDLYERLLEDRLSEYKGAVFTEDSKKYAKAHVAELRKFKKDVDDRRKEVKTAYMKPYMDFEARVKKLLGMIDEPIEFIDSQVKAFEEKRKQEKREAIKDIYDSLVDGWEEFIPFAKIYNAKWENASTTIKVIREDITQAVNRVKADVSSIRSMNSEAVDQAIERYKNTLDLSEAIQHITAYENQKAEILRKEEERKKEEERRRLEEERERIRREERDRIEKERQIEEAAKQAAREAIQKVDESAAAPLAMPESKTVVYTIVATKEEIEQVEMALNSLGIYFERKMCNG